MSINKYHRTWQHLYNARWKRFSKLFLIENPLCKYCNDLGITTKSEVTDHIKPHKGNYDLFWQPNNHQPLCKHCHDSVKAREEYTGILPGCSVDGMPLDNNHEWNKGAKS